MKRGRSRRAIGLAALVACVAATVAVGAPEPVGSDFRISNTGTDGDVDREAFGAAVAYNPTATEYLVVWQGEGLPTDDEEEIFGQRVSASGAELGSDFRISNAAAVASDRDARSPAVAYNAAANEYLVTWQGDHLVNEENEIFGQRVSASGAELGTDVRISNASAVANDRDAFRPAVAYNSAANEYLVSWDGTQLVAGQDEIFGQRVSSAGAELGTDFRISNISNAGTDRDATDSEIAYNANANEYLVTWEGDGLASGSDSEDEIFGQRVSAAGAELGTDFRISNVGTDGDATSEGTNPSIAHNPASNEYLVTWDADGLATDNEYEIFGQRLSAAGAELGGDFRISNVGADGDSNRDGVFARVAYNPTANEYLAVWEGNGLATEGEDEIFGQAVSPSGTEVGSDFRISTVGTDTDTSRHAEDPAVASGSATNEYLVTWNADGLATDDELEIFGHRLAEPEAAAPTPTPAAPKCNGKTATIFSRPGLARTFTGTSKRDVIVGTSKKDRIKGKGGNDLVCAKGGNDTVKGKGGKDKLYGQSGKDILKGGAGKDILKGGAGKDNLKGNGGKDILKGGGGADTLIGGAGTDVLAGGGGKDTQVQ